MTVQGTALAMLMPPVSFLAVWQYYKLGEVRVAAALVAAAAFLPAADFGAMLANYVPGKDLGRIFGVFAMVLGLKLMWPKKKGEKAQG